MSLQYDAVWKLRQFFVKEKIPYAVIGGIALQMWGEPRFTRDVDITIMVESVKEEAILKKIFSSFRSRIHGAIDFALKNRVCLVCSDNGCDVDISLGIPGYEEHVIRRAVNCEMGKGYKAKVCSAEDLIIHKAVAGRPQDLFDIESVIFRQGKKLNINYIRKWLKEFSRLLETEEARERFEKPWKRFLKTVNENSIS